MVQSETPVCICICRKQAMAITALIYYYDKNVNGLTDDMQSCMGAQNE